MKSSQGSEGERARVSENSLGIQALYPKKYQCPNYKMAIDFLIQDVDKTVPGLIKANLILARKFNLNYYLWNKWERISPSMKITYGNDKKTTYLVGFLCCCCFLVFYWRIVGEYSFQNSDSVPGSNKYLRCLSNQQMDCVGGGVRGKGTYMLNCLSANILAQNLNSSLSGHMVRLHLPLPCRQVWAYHFGQ